MSNSQELKNEPNYLNDYFIEIIDTQTGEIVEKPINEIPEIPRLKRFAEMIRNSMYAIEHAKRTAGIQIEEARAVRDHSIASMENNIDFLLQKATETLKGMKEKGMVVEEDAKGRPKIKINNVGKFQWRQNDPKLNSGIWDAMTDENKLAVQDKYFDCIKKEIVLKPDANAIKKELKLGTQIDGFSLEEPTQKESLNFIITSNKPKEK